MLKKNYIVIFTLKVVHPIYYKSKIILYNEDFLFLGSSLMKSDLLLVFLFESNGSIGKIVL
jgi:hypothetical protein